MSQLVTSEELGMLEATVLESLDGDPAGLDVLGHGEITLVLGWPAGAPRVAAKRLPRFDSSRRAEAYGELVHEYVAALGTRGVDCVQTEFHVIPSSHGWAAYVVQPLLDRATLGPVALAERDRTDPSGQGPRDLIAGIVAAIVDATDETVGLDGQLSNWAHTPDGLRYFDVTTPLLADGTGRTRMDLETLTSALPAPLRPAVRRFVAPGIIAKYHRPRSVLLDLAANLHKERLARWVPATLVAANRHLEVPITVEEVATYYRGDARTWELMLRLRRADRWWHRHVLHRPYGTLLPHAVAR